MKERHNPCVSKSVLVHCKCKYICKCRGNGLGCKPPTDSHLHDYSCSMTCIYVNKQCCLCRFDLILYFSLDMYIKKKTVTNGCLLTSCHPPPKKRAQQIGPCIIYSYQDNYSSAAIYLCCVPALLTLSVSYSDK